MMERALERFMSLIQSSFHLPSTTLSEFGLLLAGVSQSAKQLQQDLADRQAVLDAVLLHDRLALEFAGLLPAVDRSTIRPANLLISAYINNGRNWEPEEETLMVIRVPGGLHVTCHVQSDAMAHHCRAGFSGAVDAPAMTSDLCASFSVGKGRPLPKIDDGIDDAQQARLARHIPPLASRLQSLLVWCQEKGMPVQAEDVKPFLTVDLPLALLVCPFAEQAARLQDHVLQQRTSPALGGKPGPRL